MCDRLSDSIGSPCPVRPSSSMESEDKPTIDDENPEPDTNPDDTATDFHQAKQD